MIRVYTDMAADMFHIGHLNLIKRAKEMGDYLIVGIHSDEDIEKYKRLPIIPEQDRYEIVKSCKYVDEVIINVGGHNSKEDILFSGATHIVHGSDWTGESMYKQIGIDEKWLEDKGIEVMYLPYTRGVSTSEILEKVKNEFSKK